MAQPLHSPGANCFFSHRPGITLRSSAAGGFSLSNFRAISPGSPPSDWLLWQLADSAFPAGGFAHSNGLEAAWQYGRIRTSHDLVRFAQSALHQTAHALAPFLLAACDPAADVAELDFLLDSTLSNHVANRASRLQGQAFLATAQYVFPSRALSDFHARLRTQEAPAHLPIVFAVVASTLGFSREQTLRVYLFITLRGMFSAAVRLGATGPLEAQQLQAQLAPAIEDAFTQALAIPIDEAAQTSPLIDLWQGSQDRLYSRLFQS